MKNILLVDDDPVIIRIYRDSLANHGYNVGVASDGLEAVTSLRMVKPDLIILDLMMPRLSGADVLRYLRAQADYAGWPEIQGIQLEGIATEVSGSEGRHARAIYGAKFPIVGALARVPVAIAQALAELFLGSWRRKTHHHGRISLARDFTCF